jgi:CubicO group peptidase (beta-lactamase class C family)
LLRIAGARFFTIKSNANFMKGLLVILLFICMSLASCRQNEQQGAQYLPLITAKLDSLFISENEADRFHGTVVIGTYDSVLYQKAMGVADRVWELPMHIDHRFDIASLNKSFIAALTLLGVEENRLKLDDKLVNLLQGYSYSGSFDPQITVHHLLTHTSGLADYEAVDPILTENNFVQFKRLHFSNVGYVDFISRLKPVGQAGRQFYYSNFAYHLLSIILEDTYKKDFPELLQEKICGPLQLESTFASTSNREIHKKVVEAYNFSTEEKRWERNNFIDLTLGRRIFSSAPDLYKWGIAMSNESLLSKASLQQMQSNHLTAFAPELSYGYGWVVFDGAHNYPMGNLYINKKYLIHGGSTEGYKAMLVIVEQGEFIVTLLSNIGSQTNEMQLTQKIINILINHAHEN